MRTGSSVFSFFIYLLLACNSHADEVRCVDDVCYEFVLSEYDTRYIALKGVETDLIYKSYIDIGGGMIQYSFSKEEGVLNPDAYTLSFIKDVLSVSSKLIPSYIKEYGFSSTRCIITPERLDIYYINSKTLGDSRRFNQVPSGNRSTYNPKESLWALYDPLPKDLETSAIYITDRLNNNEVMLAHEISHYWYDRLCISVKNSIDTESFAKEFERYYERNR